MSEYEQSGDAFDAAVRYAHLHRGERVSVRNVRGEEVFAVQVGPDRPSPSYEKPCPNGCGPLHFSTDIYVCTGCGYIGDGE